MTKAQCTGVSATPSVDLTQIPEVDLIEKNGYQLCIKRSTESFISTASKMDSSGNCASGYTACGGQGSGEGAHVFCSKDTSCPITGIKLETLYPNTSYTNAGPVGTKNLYYTSSGGNGPVAEVLSSNNRVCKNNNDESYYGGSKHLLMKSNGKVQYSCEGGGDDTFVKFVKKKF